MDLGAIKVHVPTMDHNTGAVRDAGGVSHGASAGDIGMQVILQG